MAKTRAQRKAEQRRKAEQQSGKVEAERDEESHAQHETQVPETADVAEAELAERGVDLEQLKGRPADAEVASEPETVDKISRRARRQEERDRKQRAKDSEKRRAPKTQAPVERRQRGGVLGFFASCWAELKRVQWPDRETLIQASAITLVFITIMAAYLGILDAIFNWLVQRIL